MRRVAGAEHGMCVDHSMFLQWAYSHYLSLALNGSKYQRDATTFQPRPRWRLDYCEPTAHRVEDANPVYSTCDACHWDGLQRQLSIEGETYQE